MKRSLWPFLCALSLLAFAPSQVQAAYNIFMQITGITGESVDPNHKGWIDVTSFSHGLSNPGAAGGAGSRVAHADIGIGKYLDKSSLPLDLKVNTGGHTDTVTIEFQTTGSNVVVFYRVTLTDAIITATTSKGATGDVRISDTLSIAYKKIAWEYWPIDSNGKVGPVVRSEWDLSTNTGK